MLDVYIILLSGIGYTFYDYFIPEQWHTTLVPAVCWAKLGYFLLLFQLKGISYEIYGVYEFDV